MYKLRRKLLSQNFLRKRELVHKLIRNSSIEKTDLVLEIGPGQGIITEELLKQAQHVLAVELDTKLYDYLHEKFNQSYNLTLYRNDILTFSLPKIPYKVFANIPFSIEGKVIRKLIYDSNPPSDCYLVMMKTVAERLAGTQGDNLFSLSHKPFFDFSIPYYFNRYDFAPIPKVDSVLLRFCSRSDPLLPISEKRSYQLCIKQGFENGVAVYKNLKNFYGKLKTEKIFYKLDLKKTTRPTNISLEQWVELYTLLRA